MDFKSKNAQNSELYYNDDVFGTLEAPGEERCVINKIKSVPPNGMNKDNCLLFNKGSVKLIDRVVFTNQNNQSSFSCDDLKLLQKNEQGGELMESAFEFSFRRPSSLCPKHQDKEEVKKENMSIYTESISEFGDSCISPINPYDHKELMPSQKSLYDLHGEFIKILTPIPECLSAEEFSASEDSCNCVSIVEGENRILPTHRANKVIERNVKTLCDVHLKFRAH